MKLKDVVFCIIFSGDLLLLFFKSQTNQIRLLDYLCLYIPTSLSRTQTRHNNIFKFCQFRTQCQYKLILSQ